VKTLRRRKWEAALTDLKKSAKRRDKTVGWTKATRIRMLEEMKITDV
jgi:hypothetical protein